MKEGLPDRIRRRLKAVDMSARAASLAAGMAADGIRNIFRGKSTKPDHDRMVRLAGVLQCRSDWLLYENGPEELPDDEVEAVEVEALLSRYRAMSPEQRAIFQRIADSLLDPEVEQTAS